MEPLLFYLVVFVTTLTALLVYAKSSMQFWKRRKIPYIEPTFAFGNLNNPITNNISLPVQIRQLYNRFRAMGANIGGIYMFSSPVLLVMDPEHIKQILIKDFQNFHERGFYHDEENQPFSVNLFTVDGQKWRTLRTKYTPVFTSAKMKIMFNLMKEVEKSLERHAREHAGSKKPLDIKDCIGRVSSDFIGSCVFGIDCNSFKDTTFQNILASGAEGATSFSKLSFCNGFPKLARFLRIQLIPDKEGKYISNSIDESLEYRKREKIVRSDFLQLSIDMKNDNVITLDELKASCIHFFLAGFESSAMTTVFLLFELAYNQEIQRKLRTEIKDVLAKYNDDITYEAIMSMKYLDMAMCETLRKYAPVTFLNRKCVETTQLSNSDIVIEKGTNIIISADAIQNDPRFFPNPEKFDPERFSDENKSKIVPYTYIPFGEGPRFCIGDRFAKQEVKITAVSLIRKYKLRLHKEVELPLRYKFSGIFNVPADDILFDLEEVCE